MGHVQHFDSQGNEIPSVTEVKGIFKLAFLERWWRSNCDCPGCRNRGGTDGVCGFQTCDPITKSSQELGRDVHALIEAYLRTLLQ